LKSLCESKGNGKLVIAGGRNEKVALVGRSILVEVAKDWRLPGTSTVFETNDLLQIVSSKPIREGESTDEDEDPKGSDKGKKETDDDKVKAKAEEEKLKKEAYFAWKRWNEAHKKREEDDEDDDDDPEEKAKKERAKREAAQWERLKNGGWI
jgi:hypothetical protein